MTVYRPASRPSSADSLALAHTYSILPPINLQFIQRGLNPIMLARPSVESMLTDPMFDLPIMSGDELQAFMEEAMMPHIEAEDLDSSYEA